MSIEEMDMVAMDCVRTEWLHVERDLFASKWFDYRTLHPLQATYHFADVFATVYREFYGEAFDHDRAQHINAVKHDIFAVEKTRRSKSSGLWRCRQVADAAGVPYGVFLRSAYRHRLRYWRQKFLPQPVHLYSEDVMERVIDDWEQEQRIRLYVAENPVYQNQAYTGLPHQNAHHEWLFTQAQLRSDPPATIARFLDDGLLPIAKVEQRCDSETLERIRAIA